MKKALLFLFFMGLAGVTWSQTVSFNKYKYLIVDSKFDFVSEVDGYRTSSLTKFLFQKKGFEAYLDNEEYNDELAQNSCIALYAEVRDESGFLVTKSYIDIKDCKGRVLFTSQEGRSKNKSYEKAYRESIRQAFESIAKIPYKYDPSLKEETSVVKTVKEETKAKVVEAKKEVKKKPLKVVQEAPVKNTFVKKEESKPTVSTNGSTAVLYAQPNQNGFQLVNTKPAVVFVLLKTNDPEKFIIKDKNGTFTKKGNNWVAEYYENGQLVTKEYQVKF